MKSSFAATPPTYHLHKPFFLALIRQLEGDLYRRYLRLRGKSLDFGCGDGFFASHFFPTPLDIGVDINPALYLEAVDSRAYREVVIFDGHRLPFRSNYFDTVVSNCVLEHIPNLDENLREISRVLRPGGKFYVTVMESHWNQFLLGRLFFGSLYTTWMRHKQIHHNLLSRQEWTAKFKSAGLTVTLSHTYLNRRLSRLIDLFHYLGVPDLVYHYLTGRWDFLLPLRRLFPFRALLDLGRRDTSHPGGAIFFILTKRRSHLRR